MNGQFTRRKAAFGVIAGLFCLLGGAKVASADNVFTSKLMWRGFSQSSVSPTARGMVVLGIGAQSGNSFTGALFLEAKWRQVQGAVLADGSVDILGIGPDTGLKVHGGTTLGTDGSCFAGLTYQSGGGGGTGRDQGAIHGLIALLRSFLPGPTVNGVPSDPYHTAFPPGPCDGLSQNAAGAASRMTLIHTAPAESSPPIFFTGDLLFQNLHFNIVGAVSAGRQTDGSYPVAMIGQQTSFSKVIPCVRVVGRLLPAARPGDHAHLLGTYSVMDSEGATIERGNFDMAF